ncbi:uncharacterized protein LY79DRAFT_353012 [Colletotrichum navitas]|uniref:Uncharacterized protein n=1 Tax=Colletotrichum navitas TaxID=681940 RepID=A0AAD8V975_9PEZI|nr:uncharacterized protein LY79DRAFT_353012 [Colletotrichum navitas]KAK1597679.1 hypothetical protein LY79DRAFT_353012 [Colletotrichum navitas]
MPCHNAHKKKEKNPEGSSWSESNLMTKVCSALARLRVLAIQPTHQHVPAILNLDGRILQPDVLAGGWSPMSSRGNPPSLHPSASASTSYLGAEGHGSSVNCHTLYNTQAPFAPSMFSGFMAIDLSNRNVAGKGRISHVSVGFPPARTRSEPTYIVHRYLGMYGMAWQAYLVYHTHRANQGCPPRSARPFPPTRAGLM